MLFGEQAGDRLVAGGHALDLPFGHGHRQRRRFHDALVAGVGLDLEAAEFTPERRHGFRVDRAKLDRAVMGSADDAPRPGNDSLAKKIQLGRVEKVDIPLVVVQIEAVGL